MRISFRHGIVSKQAGTFLQLNPGGNVNLLANNRSFTVSIADGKYNYTHTEDNTVVDAWVGPFLSGTDYYLYMDFDPLTFERSFGVSEYAPIIANSRPSNPEVGQTWYDTNRNQQKEFIGVAFRRVHRVFVAKLSGTIFSSVSKDFPLFTGTQMGDTSSVLTGSILYTEFGSPIVRDDGSFITTEDQFFNNQSQVIGVRLESSVIRAKASGTSLAKFQIVAVKTDGTIDTAQYNQTQDSVIAVLGEDILFGEIGNLILQGTVTNPEWDFSAHGAGTRLWVLNGELTTVDPHLSMPATYPISQVPVAKVLSRNSIIFDQGLGGVGPRGPTGSIENLPTAATDSLGAVLLSTPPALANRPIVVSNNDPRLQGGPFASQIHGHDAVDIAFTPTGSLISPTVQDAISDLEVSKLNSSGGTVTGNLDIDGVVNVADKLTIQSNGIDVTGNALFNNAVTLSTDPVNPLEAVTKRYVDNRTSGLMWIDPVCLANLISDAVNDPPTSPNNGDAYILSGAGSGDWVGFVANDVVRWSDDSGWILGGQLDAISFPEMRFVIAGTSDTPASGSFTGREREIVNYAPNGTVDSYETPVDTNAIYVCNAFSSAAFNQYVYNEGDGIWRQTGGSQNGLSVDDVTIKQNGNIISTVSFANGGTVDAATYRGVDAATLFADITHNHDTTYSQLGHTHKAIDVVIDPAPITTTLHGTPANTTVGSQLNSLNVRSSLAELLDVKALRQPYYATWNRSKS